MKSGGRNDPCPCGSGRKYRDCCAAAGEAPFAAVTTRSTRESALSKLLTFAFQPVFDSDHAVAEIVFWGNLLRDIPTHEAQWLMDSDDANIKYDAWFLFDWEIEHSSTAADLFLEAERTRLTAVERQFLCRLARAHLGLYEVESVESGVGLRLLDLWTGRRMFVIERTGTVQIVTWDLLGARVAPDGVGGHVFEGGLYRYPADSKDQILAHFRRLHRRHVRKSPQDDAALFFRKHGMVFHHLWLKLVAFPSPPQVLTTEGDPLMFCRAVFETAHAEQVRGAIAAQPDVTPVEGDRFSWRRPTSQGEHELGSWTIEGHRVVFETTSQQRAARGRRWLETVAGDLVRYRATALETVDQAMNELRRVRPAKRIDPPPQIENGAVRELYDRHYSGWLDRPDADLGNRTPRAAAKTKLWRPRVIDCLKQLENRDARAALQGRPAYDFEWIWKQLGLKRPGS